MMEWLRRKLYCWQHGHDLADKSGLPGANACLRCGALWDWSI